MPSISGLPTNSPLTAVEDKMLVIQLKNRKITETEKKLTDHDYNKCVTTPEFNNLAARVSTTRLKQANF